jgi:ADP-ribose pyrophosphatase YjhB (NUDIX family)
VVALFVDSEDVLLIHQMTPPEPNCWDLPGGGLEASEDLISGLRREVLEETGIQDFQIDRLLTVTEGFYPEETGQLHTVNLVYQCSLASRPAAFQPSDLDEVGPHGIQWLSPRQLSSDQCSSRAWQAFQAAGLQR